MDEMDIMDEMDTEPGAATVAAGAGTRVATDTATGLATG